MDDPTAPLDWRTAMERYRGAFTDNTLLTFSKEFARFEAWCRQRGVSQAPAAPDIVAAWLRESLVRYAFATVKVRMGAIRRVHRALNLPDPTTAHEVWVTMRRGRREKAGPRQAAPINAALRDRMSEACPNELRGLRDRALLHLGYDTLTRHSELIGLRIEDLEDLEDGSARVRVRGDKQNLHAAPEYAFISPRGRAAIADWIAAAGLSEGPILRSVIKGVAGSGLQGDKGVAQRLRRMAQLAGLSPEAVHKIRSHSLRVGAAQDLAIQGRSLIEIMRAGRWKSPLLVMQYTGKAAVNVWSGGEGDAYPMAAHGAVWRRKQRHQQALANTPNESWPMRYRDQV